MWGPPEARDSRWLRSTKVPRRLEGPRPARCRRGARTDRAAPNHGTAATAGSAGLADHAGSECASTSSQETLADEEQKASVKGAAPQTTSRLQARHNNGLPEANDDREGAVTGKASGPAGHHRDRPKTSPGRPGNQPWQGGIQPAWQPVDSGPWPGPAAGRPSARSDNNEALPDP